MSKVAMAICALMIVTILGGVFGKGMFQDSGTELDSILDDFCAVVDMAARSRAEGTIDWKVPFLMSGERITVAISSDTARINSRDKQVIGQPVAGMHTWIWSGGCLNNTMIEELDKSAPKLSASSGEALTIIMQSIMFENEPRLFVFVRTSV